MKYRPLGSSNLQVSEISLGSWLTFGGGVERRRAIECVQTALELGITLFDTANVYALGAAESLLGEALEGVPRESYVLATKLYFPMNASDRGLSRAQIIKQIDASLKRLRTNFVDLYQCHRYDVNTPLEETMAALTEVVKAGKGQCLAESDSANPRIDANDVDLAERRVWMTSADMTAVDLGPVEAHHVVVLPSGQETRRGEPWFAQSTLKVIRDPTALIGKVGKGTGIQV